LAHSFKVPGSPRPSQHGSNDVQPPRFALLFTASTRRLHTRTCLSQTRLLQQPQCPSVAFFFARIPSTGDPAVTAATHTSYGTECFQHPRSCSHSIPPAAKPCAHKSKAPATSVLPKRAVSRKAHHALLTSVPPPRIRLSLPIVVTDGGTSPIHHGLSYTQRAELAAEPCPFLGMLRLGGFSSFALAHTTLRG
jgi:hypothetical protein